LIWSTWLHHNDLDDKQRLLAIHQATGVKIRALWALLNDWKNTGLTPELIPVNGTKQRLTTELKKDTSQGRFH